MAETTKIESTEASWNPMASNFYESALSIPLKKDKPATWLVHSTNDLLDEESDLFHETVSFEYIDRVFAVMALCPQHTFQILTKQAERMAEYLSAHDVGLRWALLGVRETKKGSPDIQTAIEWDHNGLPNVRLGVSCVDQYQADKRIPHLLNCPAHVRFLSCEPLLSQIDVPRIADIDLVIVSGESGPDSRPCNIDWIRSILKQCFETGIDCFVKQLGANVVDRNTTMACTFPDSQCWPDGTETDCHRILLKDKKGRNLDEWPEDLKVRQIPHVVTD